MRSISIMLSVTAGLFLLSCTPMRLHHQYQQNKPKVEEEIDRFRKHLTDPKKEAEICRKSWRFTSEPSALKAWEKRCGHIDFRSVSSP
jgi:hypothetical protein